MDQNNIKKINNVTISLGQKAIGSFSVINNEVVLSPDLKDEGILNLITSAQKNGIEYIECIHTNDACQSFIKKSFPSDDNFTFELIKLIKKNKYEIYEEVIEINKKINDLVDLLPEDNQMRIDILKELPGMNYLEKTYIQYQLEQKFKELLQKEGYQL